MSIEDIPNKKWTKGMILRCLCEELSNLDFHISSRKTLEYDGPIQINIEVDMHPWYKDNNFMDVYPVFLGEPKGAALVRLKLWPPAMDISFIKEALGAGSEKVAYIFKDDQAFSATMLHEDIQKYVIPFMKTIRQTEGYFDFLLGKLRKNGPKNLSEMNHTDIALLITAIQLAGKMSLVEYASQAANLLQRLYAFENAQRDQIQSAIERLPEIDGLIKRYSPKS